MDVFLIPMSMNCQFLILILFTRHNLGKIEFVIISKQKNQIKPPPLSPKTRKKQENEPQRLWGHSQLWLLHHTKYLVHGIDASQGHLDSGKTSWTLALSSHVLPNPRSSLACGRLLGNTHHASLGVPLSAVAEGGCQGGGAALVIQGSPAVVDGRVNGDGPHAGGIAVTVAVIVTAPVPRGPHIDAPFATSALGEDRERRANSHSCGQEGWSTGSWPRKRRAGCQCRMKRLDSVPSAFDSYFPCDGRDTTTPSPNVQDKKIQPLHVSGIYLPNTKSFFTPNDICTPMLIVA